MTEEVAGQKCSITPEQREQDMIKVLMQWDIADIVERDIDPEEDFFQLGLLETHGLIDENLHITPQGVKEFERLMKEMIAKRNKETSNDNQLNIF
jgi:hypothetical protein